MITLTFTRKSDVHWIEIFARYSCLVELTSSILELFAAITRDVGVTATGSTEFSIDKGVLMLDPPRYSE